MANERVYEVYRTSGFSDSDVVAASEGYAVYDALLPSDRQATVLDFGCGGGEFLEFLRARGFVALSGIDLSPEQVARCHQRGFAFVEQVEDSVAWLGAHRGQFDAIVLNDVLEHVPKQHIVETLEALRGALRASGRLLVKVPNMANAFGLVARYLDFTHEVGFSEHSLRQVLVAAKFRDIDVRGLDLAWRPTLKRTAYWLANAAYRRAHRALYVMAVGSDAPKVLSKLLIASASP